MVHSDRKLIAFFDLETTIPTRTGQGYGILEFGAILVCPWRLVELESYTSLVKPTDLTQITSLSTRCNSITRENVESAPSFSDIADKVFDLLNGRIWAGHNIRRFDCVRIREAFAEIERPPPEPLDTIDTLVLLTKKFGRRAGNMKLASLATYFGLGEQTHRSLGDVRMNFEVLKYCATVLFLESIPGLFGENNCVSPTTTTNRRSNRKLSPVKEHEESTSKVQRDGGMNNQVSGVEINVVSPNSSTPSSKHIAAFMKLSTEESASDLDAPSAPQPDPFDFSQLMKFFTLQGNDIVEENVETHFPEMPISAVVSEGCSGFAGFLEPDEVIIPSITAAYFPFIRFVPFFRGSQRIKLLHKNSPLQLYCSQLKVRFGVSTKYFDFAGRPKLSIVVDISPNLSKVLDACDAVAQKLSVESGSSSDWRPVVSRKNGFLNHPTARLNIPLVVDGETTQYATEIHQRDSSGATQKLFFSKFDAADLEVLLTRGTFVDAFFSLDPYEFQRSAGIRLVAKKIVLTSQQQRV